MTRKKPIREMSEFFDSVASTYEAHMRETVTDFDGFYGAAAAPIPETDTAIFVLDLGCGTGLELEWLFQRASNAMVTGVDMSAEMLKILTRKHRDRLRQICLVQGSYEEIDLPASAFDVCLSVMSLHHFVYSRKRAVYERVRRALKPGGLYIEGDWYVTPAEEISCMTRYLEAEKSRGGLLCHVDIPFSLPTQLKVLEEAGFEPVEVFWKQNTRAVITARRP